MNQIGIDTLRIFLPEYSLKKGTDVILNVSENKPEENKFIVRFDNGETGQYESLKLKKNNEKMQVNFKGSGLSAKVAVPKVINGNNFEMLGHKANKQAFEYMFDSLTDSGIVFDKKDTRNSRIDITRNLDLNFPVSDYYNLMSMIPRTKPFNVGSSKYQGNKSFMLCVYDKIQDSIDKKQIIPSQYVGKNIGRFEARLQRGSKLKTDTKKAGVNLLEMESLTDSNKFKKVQGLYISYMQDLFKTNYKTLASHEESKILIQLRALRMQGINPLSCLAIVSNVWNLFSLEEVSKIMYPKERRYQHSFRKRMERNLDESKKTGAGLNVLYSEMYSEIRKKALARVA